MKRGLVQEGRNPQKIAADQFIKGGKPFDPTAPWFGTLLAGIGQPKGAGVRGQP